LAGDESGAAGKGHGCQGNAGKEIDAVGGIGEVVSQEGGGQCDEAAALGVGKEEAELVDDLSGLRWREGGGGGVDGYGGGVCCGGRSFKAEARAGAAVTGCAGACRSVGGDNGGDDRHSAGGEVALCGWGCNGYGAGGVLGS
jgi:hypothetical protein